MILSYHKTLSRVVRRADQHRKVSPHSVLWTFFSHVHCRTKFMGRCWYLIWLEVHRGFLGTSGRTSGQGTWQARWDAALWQEWSRLMRYPDGKRSYYQHKWLAIVSQISSWLDLQVVDLVLWTPHAALREFLDHLGAQTSENIRTSQITKHDLSPWR